MSVPCNEGADKETMAWKPATKKRAIPALLNRRLPRAASRVAASTEFIIVSSAQVQALFTLPVPVK